MKLAWSDYTFNFSLKTYIMGILNITPDSFSDGGLYFNQSSAIRRGLQMVENGADIIDIGGESTRPGAEPVTVEEELRRIIPIVRTLSKEIKIPLSIDTYKSDIARKALDAGASMVNDISGLRLDPAMSKLIADYKVPVVIMHMKGTPKNMQKKPGYKALIPEITDYLKEGITRAKEAGISEDMIMIDPGIGFGKTFEHNLEIIHDLHKFTVLGRPILIGPSRKAFIGKILGDAPPQERLEGTAAAVAISIMNGANIVRIHDVKQMVKVATIADAIKRKKIQEAGPARDER